GTPLPDFQLPPASVSSGVQIGGDLKHKHGAYPRIARPMKAKAFFTRSSTIMNARVLVLGAPRRRGRTPARAFRGRRRTPGDAGWTVASLLRPGSAARAPADTEVVEVHALDHAAVGEAARGADVVLHALNPSYTDWPRLALPLAYSAITAAETAGATLLFPGN